MKQEEIDEIIERELPNMPGWCTPEKGKRLAALAREAELAVELGVFGARSLISIALGLPDHGRVHGIDPFTPVAALEGANHPQNDKWWANLDYETIARSAQETLYRLELIARAQLIRMHSCDVVGFYKDNSVSFLHQDSNHAEEVSCREVALWAPKIKPGGLWVFDDTNWETTKEAQDRLVVLGFVELEDHESWKVYRK